MNCKRTAAFAMIAALAAFSPTGIGQDFGAAYAFTQAEQYSYENGGLMLLIPKAYDDLLVTKIIKDRKDGMLFTVSEKASMEAAKTLPYKMRRAGWLFTIGRVDEGRRRELLCGNIPGADIFARDANGQHYVFYHPTDVRYVRENNEAMKRDQDQWIMLNKWAGNSVQDEFRKENGLEAVAYDDSEIGISIARAAYKPDVRYTISTTKSGPIEGKNFDAAPYAERLLQNASYEMVKASEMPDEDCIVLEFPDRDTQVLFFLAEGKENYVLEVRRDVCSHLYKATFADGTTKAGEVMQAWYDAMAAQQAE